MTSRPQFPPCGIKKLWFLTLGGGVTSPFENLLVMDPHSPEMHIPTNFCVQFQGVCVDRQLQSKVENPRIGQLLSFLTTQKKKIQTKIVPYVHSRFTVYKALLIPQTPIGRGGNWGANYRVTCLRSLGQLLARPGSKPSSSDSGACLPTPQLLSEPRPLRRHKEEKAK